MKNRPLFPIYAQNNISPSDKNLYVTSVDYHVSAHNENTLYSPKANVYRLHYIFSGSYRFNDRVLKPGDGCLISPETEIYSLASQTWADSFVTLSLGGYLAKKFLLDCSIPAETHFFSHPHGFEIAGMIKEVACAEITDRNIDYVLTALLYNVMSFHKQNTIVMQNPFRSMYDFSKSQTEYINVILKYIDVHYRDNITIAELAKLVHLSPNYLSTTFKKFFGVPLQLYITKYRISVAEQLLSNTVLPISTVAEMTGYSDAPHFSQVFRKLMGMSPTKYRQLTSLEQS